MLDYAGRFHLQNGLLQETPPKEAFDYSGCQHFYLPSPLDGGSEVGKDEVTEIAMVVIPPPLTLLCTAPQGKAGCIDLKT